MKTPPDSGLTLTDAFTRYYRIDELRGSTIVAYQSALKLWERLTERPDVREIDNAMVDNFRAEALKEFAPYTVNRYWGACRSILRRIGPQETRNPWGLGIINHIPAMRPCKVPFKRPRRLSMEELDRIYLAARHMTKPCRHVPHPGYWWQAVVVMAYYSGLRLADLLKIRWSELNIKDGTLFVRLNKTEIEADLPLPDIALSHLARLERRNERIFHIDQRKFTSYQAVLREHSNVQWTMHDIRRTACSEADRVRSGMGKVLLLQAPCNVTERSYLNSLPELREVVEKMGVPTASRHGPKMAMRSLKEAKKVVNLRPRDLAVPTCPPAELFAFSDHGFTFNGSYIRVTRRVCQKVIETLVANEGKCSQRQLWEATEETPFPDGGHFCRKGLARNVSRCRRLLCQAFGLPDGFNPICPTLLDPVTKACQYELLLPPALWQDANRKAS